MVNKKKWRAHYYFTGTGTNIVEAETIEEAEEKWGEKGEKESEEIDEYQFETIEEV